MTTTILAYTISLVFTDFDECWNAYHALDQHSVSVTEMCEEVTSDTHAPLTSLRPVARGDEQ